jgi:hypothetical protein
MRKSHKFVFFLALWFALSAFGQKSVEELLRSDDRPDILETAGLSREEISGLTSQGIEHFHSRIKKHLNLIGEAVEALLSSLPEWDVFCFARDTDEVMEGLRAAVAQHPQGNLLLTKIHRMNVSRNIIDGYSPALMQWLALQGFVPAEIRAGKMKAYLVDIGWKGSQPYSLLKLALADIPDTGDVQAAALATLDGIDGRVLGPSQSPFLPGFRSRIRGESGLTKSRLLDLFEETSPGFAGVLTSYSDTSAYSRASSLKSGRVNWRDGVLSLNSQGTAIASYTHSTDVKNNKEAVLVWQWLIAAELAKPEWKNRLTPLIDQAVARLPRAVVPASAAPAPAPVLRIERVPAAFAPLAVAALPAPKGLEVVRLKATSGEPERRLVITESDAPESAEELAAQQRRLPRLENTGIPYLPLREVGAGFFVQEYRTGVSGREWLTSWVARNRPADDPGLPTLRELTQKMLDAKIYVRHLTPESLWFDGKQWWVTALGGVQTLPPPEVLWNIARNFRERWDADLARLLMATFRTDFPLKLRPPVDKAILHLDSGLMVQVHRQLRAKEHTLVYEVDGSDGKKHLLKIARDAAGEENLERERRGFEQLARAQVPASEVEEYGRNYLLKRFVPGVTGDSWLKEQFAQGNTAAAADLGALLTKAANEGLFISGLWPSHLTLADSHWQIVNHHGVHRRDDALQRFRERFNDRWASRLPPDCREALIKELFVGGGSKP